MANIQCRASCPAFIHTWPLKNKTIEKQTEKICHFEEQSVIFAAALKAGGLAQLARALAWHARGHRFESGILHVDYQGFVREHEPFFVDGLNN